jgi:hypothetical protein
LLTPNIRGAICIHDVSVTARAVPGSRQRDDVIEVHQFDVDGAGAGVQRW